MLTVLQQLKLLIDLEWSIRMQEQCESLEGGEKQTCLDKIYQCKNFNLI